MNLSGSKALVTGAAGGIGRAIVAELIQRGVQVLLVGRDQRALERVAIDHDAHRSLFELRTADLGTSEVCIDLCQYASQWRGGVNILINNAGQSPFGLYEDLTPRQIDSLLAVNLHATMHLCHGLLPRLRASAPSAIVNIGSVFGGIGYPGYAAYSATKFAVRGFTEALRRELCDSAVAVQYVAPRATRTRLNSAAVEHMNRELGVAFDPPQRVAAAVIESLVSERPSAVIGWPEKFFVKMNALTPSVVDRALRKQLGVIRRHARPGKADDSAPATAEAAIEL